MNATPSQDNHSPECNTTPQVSPAKWADRAAWDHCNTKVKEHGTPLRNYY